MEKALLAFFAGVFMELCNNICYGIAAAFIFYCVIKIVKGEIKGTHPILWISSALFVLNFISTGHDHKSRLT